MPVPAKVLELVDRFNRNADEYRALTFNETNLRIQFIDPMFTALGWDMANEQGHAEAYKDVVHEAALKIGEANKAPDYCFRIGGTPKFYLEAKKPAVNIKEDASPAYQLRRYAWSAKFPLSILTDFEEFAVYDGRVKPNEADKASAARILCMRYDEYADKWDQIADVFAREAILKGSFDKYADTNKKKRGTATVDAAFLGEIEGWRTDLAKNFALRNPKLTSRELNYAVQMTIDRIIFLRMCEDRGMEPYATLRDLVGGKDVYKDLMALFRKADDRYNSGLFHFENERDRPESHDALTPHLKLDDKVLSHLLEGLYYPKSPYVFSKIPTEILGQVYEQFLGKVIRLTSGHQARVEEKPEVKKAGGVYYTPTYIVDYIVKHTVGKLLEGKTPKEAGKLRVLDPACGSGSFLLGAYQFLLDWHLDYYRTHDPEKWSKELFRDSRGEWSLTTQQKKRILLNNIYGVDIDAQAVEVTKLSLLLKVLENETQESINSQRSLFHGERVLPDLASNIKCGNSLIGPDFYDDPKQGDLFNDEEERLRINVFDWKAAFPSIMKAGGFDAVIGNPPYIRMEAFKELKSYLRANFDSHDERSDIYGYFMERAHKLLRKAGMFGMIVSNKFIRANYGEKLREFIGRAATIESLVDLAGLPVFRGATVRTIVLISRKTSEKCETHYSPPSALEQFLAVEAGRTTLGEWAESLAYDLPPAAFTSDVWQLAKREHTSLMARLSGCGLSLGRLVNKKICRGVVSGLTEAFVIDREQRANILKHNPEAKAIIRPFLQGRDIRKYFITPRDEFLIYTPHDIDMRQYPAVIEHLKPFKQQLEGRATKQAWYELQQPQFAYVGYLEKPKIVFPDIATSVRFALDREGRFGVNTVYFLPTDDLYLLGLLNSRVAQFYFKQTCAALEGPGEAYLRFFGQYLEDFPVRQIELGDKSSQLRRDRIVSLVERLIMVNAHLLVAKTPHDQAAIQSQIAATDRQIDQLVYELYGLTDDEIRIVEGDGPT